MSEFSDDPRIEGLLDLACRSGVDVRPTLLRVLTDLYVQAPSHTPSEEQQYIVLALPLIDSVDAATRGVVASRLAAYPRAPHEVLDKLEAVTGTPAIASPPLAPAAPPEINFSDAFFAAGSYERQMILTDLDAGDQATSRRGPPAAVETCRQLEAAILEGNTGEFVRLLGIALTLPPVMAERIVADPLGEPVVIAARALGMESSALQRILLVINPSISHSVSRVYELAALYEEVSPRTAESMIDIWRGSTPVRRSTYQPALWDDEQRSARAVATPSRYQGKRRSDALAARFRNSGR